MSIEKQNQLFPNNLEHRLRQKLQKQYNDVTPAIEEEKTLEVKIKDENDALNLQKYLIEGAIKELTFKKQDIAALNRGLIKQGTDKWLRKRDTKTKNAQSSQIRGAFFGQTLP